jgi:2-(1,2-epoxy-1,2-dihydrophenyl)acetyl-CoA isomerase
MCLSGRLYQAAEAYEKGLVDRMAAPEELLPAAFGVAREFAGNPAPQLRMIKELLTRNGSETDLSVAQQRETQHLRACWKTEEHREAVRAFFEKRPPRFRGAR